MENNKLSVIVPIHYINDKEYELFFEPAINSVLAQKQQNLNIVFVLSKDVFDSSFRENVINGFRKQFEELKSNLSFICVEDDTDYCSMVNAGVDIIESSHFTVLEFDDVYNHKWFENFETYLKAYPEVKLFLPIVTHVDSNNNYITLQNEIAHAIQSIDEHDGKMEIENTSAEDVGFATFDSVHKKMKYSLVGGIFNTEAFLAVGKLKPSHKYHFDYEFLLRFLYQGNRTIIITRTGIKHTNMRDDSYSKSMGNVSEDEKRFWYFLARKEYMFPIDRKITYQVNN